MLCYISYALVGWTMLAGAVAYGEANAAWALRHEGVTWCEGPGFVGLFRPSLFPPHAQAARLRAARWQLGTLGSALVTLGLAVILSGPAESAACWRTP